VHEQRFSFLIMEQSCGPLTVEIVTGKHCDFSTYLARERELSLEHVQRCSYLIIEQSCGPLAVDIVLGKHFDFSTYLAKRARAQTGACAEVQFPNYGTVLWSPGSRNFSRNALRFQHLPCQKRARAKSGACAEVHFPDYGTVFWSRSSRNFSRKALRF
jgi:hypothetical protein